MSKEKDPEMQELVEKRSAPNTPSSPINSKSAAASGKALSSCMLYSFCSVSMVLVNKSLASRCVQMQILMIG